MLTRQCEEGAAAEERDRPLRPTHDADTICYRRVCAHFHVRQSVGIESRGVRVGRHFGAHGRHRNGRCPVGFAYTSDTAVAAVGHEEAAVRTGA